MREPSNDRSELHQHHQQLSQLQQQHQNAYRDNSDDQQHSTRYYHSQDGGAAGGMSGEEILTNFLNDLSFWEMRDDQHSHGAAAMYLNHQIGRQYQQAHHLDKRNRNSKLGTGSPGQWSTRGEQVINNNDDVDDDNISINSDEVTWRLAVDPNTGRTYYYDKVTRQTQWDKPWEIRALEKRRKRDQRLRDSLFFQQMERNLTASIARGELIPGIPLSETQKQGPPEEPLLLTPLRSSGVVVNKVRTISCMDEDLLAEIHQQDGNRYGTRSNHMSTAGEGRLLAGSPAIRPNTTTGQRDPRLPPITTTGRPPLPSRLQQQQQQQQKQQQRQQQGFSSTLNATTTRANENNVSATHGRVASDYTSSTSDLEEGALRGLSALLDERRKDETHNPPDTGSSAATEAPDTPGHVRRNTGGTIFVRSTMENPDIQATIKCVCGVYRAHIVQATAVPSNKRSPVSVNNTLQLDLEVFRDDYDDARVSNKVALDVAIPPLADIEQFYQQFFQRSQMEHDTIIMSLIYVERLIKETNGSLSPTAENWASVLFSCMVLASKVWDDLSMWNIDFSNVSLHSGLSRFTLKRVNQLELAVLTCLNFNVKVSASEYAKYYFLIRTMLIRSGLLDNVDVPLKKEDAKLLESKTSQYQNSKLKGQAKRVRAKSFDWNWQSGRRSVEAGPVLKDTICLEQLVSMNSVGHVS